MKCIAIILVLACLFVTSISLASPQYQVHELPSPTSGFYGYHDVNGAFVVGTINDVGFIRNWRTGEQHYLDVPAGVAFFPTRITEGGAIAGTAFDGHNYLPYIRSPINSYSALERIPPTSYFTDYRMTGITDTGYTCAIYRDDSGFDGGSAVWHGSQLVGNAYGFDATSINNEGTTVGWDQGHYGYYQRIGQSPVNLTWVPNGDSFVTRGINDAGFMIGEGHTRNSSATRYATAVWNPDGTIRSSRYFSQDVGQTDINNRNEAIFDLGFFTSGNLVATGYYWDVDGASGPTSLDSLLDSQATSLGYAIHRVQQIDNYGNILAQATLPGGSSRFVVLQPVPEPGSLAVLALGAVGLLKRRK